MICLLITLIFLILKYFNVIHWSYWFVFLPLMIEGVLSTWLMIKTEFEYMRMNIKAGKENKE